VFPIFLKNKKPTLSTDQRQLLKKFDSLQLKLAVAAVNQEVDCPIVEISLEQFETNSQTFYRLPM